MAIRRLAPLLAALALLVPACSSGGGDDGGGGDNNLPSGPTRCVSYTSASPSSGEVALERPTRNASNCDVLELAVNAAGFDDVFAAELVIDFDPQVLTFTGVSDNGSHLRSDGESTSANGSADGRRLTVGITRVQPGPPGAPQIPGINFGSAGELLMTVFFSKARNDEVLSSDVKLLDLNSSLLDSQSPPQPIGNPTWLDGTVSIQ